MNERFLVTAANGDISEAIGRVLRELYPGTQLHGADCHDVWPGLGTYDEMHSLPRADSPDYLNSLWKLADRLAVQFVFVVNEAEIHKVVVDQQQSHRDSKWQLMVSNPGAVLPFLDKLDTVNWLAKRGFPVPATMLLSDVDVDALPVIVKPRTGSGSKGITIVYTPRQLELIQGERIDEAVIAQSYIAGDDNEYTCAVFRGCGETRTIIMRRSLIGGLTSRIQVVENTNIDQMLVGIAEHAELEGSINVQLRIGEIGPQIFEINPRFSSTVMMRHCIGFRDIEWTLLARQGKQLPAYENPVGYRVFRQYREVVAPLC